MKAVIVNTCNEWKEYSSFRLVGVYTNRRKLISMLNSLISNKTIVNNTGYLIKDMTTHEMHNCLEYVSLEEIDLNCSQISLV